jgi:Tfp pilus assembly protein PilO
VSPSRPPRARLFLQIGLGFAIAVVLTLVVFFPQVREAAAARSEARRKQAELARAVALVQQRNEIVRQYAAAKLDAEALVTRIPREPDLPGLLARLDLAIASSGVKVEQISFLESPPAAGAPGGTPGSVASLPLQLRVTGRYPQIRALVLGLDESPRLVVVDRMTLTGTDAGITTELFLRALFLR